MEYESKQLTPEFDENYSADKPNLDKWMFWDVPFEKIKWQKQYIFIIERVIERGKVEKEWQELIRFYGYDKVVHVVKYDSNYLMDHTIEMGCNYFNLKPEELKCYRRKQSMPRTWL